MKLIKALLLFLIFQNLAGISFGQQNLVYNHYFINPYLYNPSYVASNGYSELFLNYRKTWGDFSKTATANLQIPINHKLGIGASFYNDKSGIYGTNTGFLTIAYQIHFGKDYSKINRLGFGLSGGYTSSKLDLSKVSNPDDPAYKATSAAGMQGQFGINYQYQKFKIGFALPRLLKSQVVTSSEADSVVSPFESTIATISYNFQLGPRISFEPYFLYRTEKNMPSQFEALGVLRIDNIGWIGGAYRQEYGASAFLGLNLKERIKVGYAYEFAPNQVSGIGTGSHEVQLVLRLSKKKKVRPQRTEKTVAVVDKTEQVDSAEVKIGKAPVELQESNEKAPSESNQSTVKPVEQEQSTGKETEVIQHPLKEEVSVNENSDDKKPETKPVTKSLEGKALDAGHYVVVGAFRSVQNAKSFTVALKKAGYPANTAFNPDKGYYIVHMGVTPTMEEAQRLRDIYRQKSRYSFKDTWILTIE
jgi:type IX secretion system PorP/SprF family membrane protein